VVRFAAVAVVADGAEDDEQEKVRGLLNRHLLCGR
jgi:hypothetical protein